MGMVLSISHAPRAVIDDLLARPDRITTFFEDEEVSHSDLDKAWHGIHFLLTGDAWSGTLPAATLLSGGREVGDIDLGYGPARAFSPEEASAFQAHIAAISAEQFDARFDAKRLIQHDIYPTIWDRDLRGEADGRPYLNEYFQILKDFMARAVAQGDGLVICMC